MKKGFACTCLINKHVKGQKNDLLISFEFDNVTAVEAGVIVQAAGLSLLNTKKNNGF